MAIDPSVPAGDIALMTTTWAMMRAIMGGTQAMRDAGDTYLPQYEGETQAGFDARLERSVLTNYLDDAVRNAVALPFRKDVEELNVPDDIKELGKNIDLLGNDFTQFSRLLLEDGGLMGYGFILVDFSKNETEGSAAGTIAAEGENRPYWVFIKADDVIACYTKIVGNKEVVTHFRYKERVVDVDEEYKEVIKERVRVYKPGEYEVWEKDGGTYEIVDSGPMTITDEVPVVPVWCGKRLGGFQVKPLFLDLAFKQVEHWQSSSDQRNILSFARFPMLACSGAGNTLSNEIVVGPSKVLTTEAADGKWYFVEPEGSAIDSGRRDLEDLKEEMRILGLQPLVGKSGNITATQRALDETRVFSAVQILAMNMEDALKRAIGYTERWLGREPTIDLDIRVNRDFGLSIRDTAEVDSLIRARITGEISRRTFWTELKRRQVLAPDFNADAEAAQLEKEFASGEIPFTVSAALPDMPVNDSEKQLGKDMNITNTFAEMQSARNSAFKKGRAPTGSQEPASASKSVREQDLVARRAAGNGQTS